MDKWDLLNKLNLAKLGIEVASDGSKAITPENTLSLIFDRRISTPESFANSWKKWEFASQPDFPALRNRKVVRFPSGNNLLTGYLYEQPSPKGIFLCVHGMNSLADDSTSRFQNEFYTHGYDVFAIDLTACGRSEGSGVKGLSQSALDVASAEDFLAQSDLKNLPLFLFGHSWGAYGVSASLNLRRTPLAIFAFAGFSDPVSIMISFPDRYAMGVGSLSEPAMKEAMLKRDPEYAFLSGKEGIENASGTYVVLLQGDADKVVGYPNPSLAGQEYARNGVEKIIVPGRGHNDALNAEEAIAYTKQVEENILEPMKKKYGKHPSKMSKEDKELLLSSFDRRLTSALDPKIFARIFEIAESRAKEVVSY